LLAGASVNIHGSGFLSDADVAIAVYSLPATLDEVTARSDGTFDDTVTLPSSLTGDHTLVAIGDGPGDSAVSLEAAVRLEAPTSTPSSSSPTAAGRLATSGIDAGAIALGGLALIAIGLLLLRSVTLWRRRLRHRGWEHISP
jgi:hypothetical protein